MHRFFNRTLINTIALASIVANSYAAEDVSDKPQCQVGDVQCVHHVVQEMSQRFHKLEQSCDHDAIFALVYLRTTETYEATGETIGYEDPSSVNREDALFADYYFRAYDAYHTGSGALPPAWQIAFAASDLKLLTAQGNALLGINAHIQRDLPFVLYDLYERGYPVSEYDHFKVNEFLAQVQVSSEIIESFDPSYPAGDDASGIIFWRTLAWQNYLALRDAPTAEARAAVALGIEQYAAAYAQQFVALTAYPPGQDSSARDEYCAR